MRIGGGACVKNRWTGFRIFNVFIVRLPEGRLSEGKRFVGRAKENAPADDLPCRNSFMERHMSFSIGFPNAAALTIGGKSASTLKALSEASADSADKALGETEESGKVRANLATEAESKTEKAPVPKASRHKRCSSVCKNFSNNCVNNSNNWLLRRRVRIRRLKPKLPLSWLFRGRSPIPPARCSR